MANFHFPSVFYLPAVEQLKLAITCVDIPIGTARKFVPRVVAVRGAVHGASVWRRCALLSRAESHRHLEHVFPVDMQTFSLRIHIVIFLFFFKEFFHL